MKLIDLLVKELPKRGGWPEGALNATQDKDGQVCFSACAVPEFGYVAWEGGDWLGNEFYTTRADDYDTAIITRAQYEAALEASEGWIEWHGGDCPVDSDAIVEVKYRIPKPYQYNNYNDRAGDFDWEHIGSNADIIAYRLHDQGINSSASNEQLEQDLNECIGQGVVTEWDGEGLPPVGVECEWLASGDHEWIAVTVLCYDGEDAWLKPSDGSQSFVVWNIDNFRQLRTEAERKRDAAIEAIDWFMPECIPDTPNEFYHAKKIYDAIAAGKIPGVKLEGK